MIEKYSTETEITPPPPLPPVGVNEECVPDCGENAICKVQKSLRITDIQLLQGIVRGQPDCECKEGCKGDPFKKCDCDLPNPANGTATIPLLAPTATKIKGTGKACQLRDQ